MNSLRDLEITDHGICACLQALSGNDDVFVYSHRREIVPQRDIRTILVSSTERAERKTVGQQGPGDHGTQSRFTLRCAGQSQHTTPTIHAESGCSPRR